MLVAPSDPAVAASSLAGPTGLIAVDSTPTSLTMTWSAIPSAQLYAVQVATSPTMADAVTQNFRVHSGSIVGLKEQTTYYVRVRVMSADGVTPRSEFSPIVSVVTAAPPFDLRLATYNIGGAYTDGQAIGEHKLWVDRRLAVVNTIVRQKLDVIGLQELWWRKLGNGSALDQIADLRNGLAAAGQQFEVTNEDPSASNGTRIFFNPEVLEKVRSGEFRFAAQFLSHWRRYFAWAVFRHRETGHEFFFVSTHLTPFDGRVRYREWIELIRQVKALNADKLPVVITGDFNATRGWSGSRMILPTMKRAGFADALGQVYGPVVPRRLRAAKVGNAWINSFNGYRRLVSDYSFATTRHRLGYSLDWIFASNQLHVKSWVIAADYDPATLLLRGTIPSDHFLVASTIVIP